MRVTSKACWWHVHTDVFVCVWSLCKAEDEKWTVKWPGWPAVAWLWHLFFAMKETRCCRYSVAWLLWSSRCVTLWPMAASLNHTIFLEEKVLSISEGYQFVEHCELWTRISCVWTAAAGRSGTQLLIYNSGDVSASLLSEAKGWTLLLVNMLTVALL